LGYFDSKVWCNVSLLDNSDQFISSDNSHTSAKFRSSGMLYCFDWQLVTDILKNYSSAFETETVYAE